MKLVKGDLFKVRLDNINWKKFNKLEYYGLCMWYRFMRIFAKVSGLYEIDTKYYRKLCALNFIYGNQHSKVYVCGMCHHIIFKGDVKRGIIVNCQNCGSVFTLHKKIDGSITKTTKSSTTLVDENSLFDSDIYGKVKILGIEYNIKDY